MGLNLHPKFVAVDKETNDDIMHLNRLGKADRLASQAFNRSSAKVTLCLSGAALPTSDVVEQIESGFDELIDSASEIAHGA
jgi:hypothetical protein